MLLSLLIGVGIIVPMSVLSGFGNYASGWLYPIPGLLLGCLFEQFKTKLDTTNKRLQLIETKLLKFEQQLAKSIEAIVETASLITFVNTPATKTLPQALQKQALAMSEPLQQALLSIRPISFVIPS